MAFLCFLLCITFQSIKTPNSTNLRSVPAWRSGVLAWRSGMPCVKSPVAFQRGVLAFFCLHCVSSSSKQDKFHTFRWCLAWCSGVLAWRSGMPCGNAGWRSGVAFLRFFVCISFIQQQDKFHTLKWRSGVVFWRSCVAFWGALREVPGGVPASRSGILLFALCFH